MTRPVLILVVCAAPPAEDIDQLATQITQRGWDVYAVVTTAAAAWIDEAKLAAATGNPVRTRTRLPTEPKLTPKADFIVVTPATFNTINQWAAGINNAPALGVLNEALGAGIPIVAAPYAKQPLAAHPAFARSLRFLADAGVQLLDPDALRPDASGAPYKWDCVLDQLPEAAALG